MGQLLTPFIEFPGVFADGVSSPLFSLIQHGLLHLEIGMGDVPESYVRAALVNRD
jgi:hypothetical protein